MTDQIEQPKNIYRKHIKPNWYVAKFGERYVNFDLGYLGEIFPSTEQEHAEHALVEQMCTTSLGQAKLLYVNLRRFALWLESENLSDTLGKSRNLSRSEREKNFVHAYDSYVKHAIGNGRYFGRDVSALWRGLNLFHKSGLPIPELKQPSDHAKERAHSISLRIGSAQVQSTIESIYLLHEQMKGMNPKDVEAVVISLCRRPELRNFCEIRQFTEELKKVARSDLLR